MARFELTAAAKRDLSNIADYTIETHGIKQARKYRDGLFATFDTLAHFPQMGRDYNRLKTGYRRHQYESHVIYYRSSADGVRIMRILHKSQDPMQNL